MFGVLNDVFVVRFSFLFVEEVYEFWRDVFGSCESILGEVFKEKARTVVDQFKGILLFVFAEIDEDV